MQNGVGPEPSQYGGAANARRMPGYGGPTERSGAGGAGGSDIRTTTYADQASRANSIYRRPILERIFGGIASRRNTRIALCAGCNAHEKRQAYTGHGIVFVAHKEYADAPYADLLRTRHHRPRRRASEPRDELPPSHRSSSRPFHRQPISDEDALERPRQG